jgi:hypothetical protein
MNIDLMKACPATPSTCPAFTGTISTIGGKVLMSQRPAVIGTGIVAAASADIWIEAEFAHKKVINGTKLDSLYVQYKSNGNWAVLGTIGDRDILIKTCACERDANDWLDALQKKLS